MREIQFRRKLSQSGSTSISFGSVYIAMATASVTVNGCTAEMYYMLLVK